MIYIGIDPGVNGAVAVINERFEDAPVRVFDVPVAKASKGQDYLTAEMRQLLIEIAWVRLTMPHHPEVEERMNAWTERHVGIEQTNPFPAQGRTTLAKQAYGIGLWRGIVVGLGLPHEMILASRWQADVGLPKGATKDIHRQRAAELFPALADLLKRKSDDGRADALLIAEALRRRLGRG